MYHSTIFDIHLHILAVVRRFGMDMVAGVVEFGLSVDKLGVGIAVG